MATYLCGRRVLLSHRCRLLSEWTHTCRRVVQRQKAHSSYTDNMLHALGLSRAARIVLSFHCVLLIQVQGDVAVSSIAARAVCRLTACCFAASYSSSLLMIPVTGACPILPAPSAAPALEILACPLGVAWAAPFLPVGFFAALALPSASSLLAKLKLLPSSREALRAWARCRCSCLLRAEALLEAAGPASGRRAACWYTPNACEHRTLTWRHQHLH